MLQSELRPGEFIVDDSTPAEATNGRNRGRVPRDWSKQPHCSMAGARSMPTTIKRAEWPERIARMEQTKTRLSDLMLQGSIDSLDQAQTNYCWTNAVVTAILAGRCASGLPYVKLSPASVAAPVKGYWNQGGWGGEALEYIVANGIASTEQWPANAIDRSYFTPSRANAALHKVTEWYDLNSGDFDQLMTCLFMRIPVAIGLNWWSHEVCAIDPVMISPGKFGVRFRNSWGNSFGEKGFAILTEGKATPDDACAPIVNMAATV